MSADWREMHSLGSKEFVATTEEPRRDWTEKYIPETDKPRVRAAINRAIATRSNFELEHRVIRLDGTVGLDVLPRHSADRRGWRYRQMVWCGE
ncbi:hypothetical protein ANSO36C_43470 [Nostoc cf. commune SO-36]|uniref:Transposase n=1 Tax=Nostoc cf. commune SO-36 TaxID=449208 RepID=A0ABM7Z625_NOSCO|nr:hypothetical protein ANSO36C_43470 [Nostoc cf. commune SO-36]